MNRALRTLNELHHFLKHAVVSDDFQESIRRDDLSATSRVIMLVKL